MAREVLLGVQVRFAANVYNKITLEPDTTSAITGPIQLELAGDPEDGFFWDTDSGGSWKALGSVVSHPTLAHLAGSFREYVLPAAANTRDGATIKMLDATDNLAVPASQTTLPQGLETVLARRKLLPRNEFLSLK